MTQKTFISIFFTMIFSLASYAVMANGHTAKAEAINKEMKTTTASDHTDSGHKIPASAEADSKIPHGKTSAPHMEELPHVHKFHKERVKKIKKHHSKFWLLAKIVVVLCHLSILLISYMHATH